MDVLVTYDIADTDGVGAKRLRRISDVCCKYGERVQFSVFECRLSRTRLERMIGEIEDVIDKSLDTVAIYRLPGHIDEAKRQLGRPQKHEPGQPWIL